MKEIQIWLIRKGLKQADIAKRLGVSRPYLSRVLSGKRKADHVRRKLVRVVGMPARLIRSGVEQRRAA